MFTMIVPTFKSSHDPSAAPACGRQARDDIKGKKD
jgi:hypothetical protein